MTMKLCLIYFSYYIDNEECESSSGRTDSDASFFSPPSPRSEDESPSLFSETDGSIDNTAICDSVTSSPPYDTRSMDTSSSITDTSTNSVTPSRVQGHGSRIRGRGRSRDRGRNSQGRGRGCIVLRGRKRMSCSKGRERGRKQARKKKREEWTWTNFTSVIEEPGHVLFNPNPHQVSRLLKHQIYSHH